MGCDIMNSMTTEKPISDGWEKYPGAFSLKPNVSADIVAMINAAIDSLPETNRGMAYMGFTTTYQAPMWFLGGMTPIDWYQTCRCLHNRGVDVSKIVEAANAA